MMLLNIYYEIDHDYFNYQNILGINLYFYTLFQINVLQETIEFFIKKWKFPQNIIQH